MFAKKKLRDKCAIQGEVLKRYQEIREITHMPDFLFHVPNSKCNLMVVEIKLASSTKEELKDDLDKLARFRRVLRYETLVEILIGSNKQLSRAEKKVGGCFDLTETS